MSDFFEQVYDIVAVIPSGKVVSYGQIARALGSPRSARMVGWAMARCPEGLPWHRVIKNDGSISGCLLYTSSLFYSRKTAYFVGFIAFIDILTMRYVRCNVIVIFSICFDVINPRCGIITKAISDLCILPL